jgi:small-conductance mechanosensitive channel
MTPFDRFEQLVQSSLGLSPPVTESALATAAVLLTYVVLARLARRLVFRLVTDVSMRFQVNKAIAYGLAVVALLVAVKIWVHEVSGLATYLGLLSAGLAIALQDPVANFAAWIYIVLRRPFGIGERIQVGQFIGDVVDIRPFRFVLLEIGNWVHAEQTTGRVVHVPNAMVFKNPVANYDEAFGYIWNELELVVTFESDWKKAKESLLQTVNEHSEKLSPDVSGEIRRAAEHLHIKFGKVTPVVWTTVVEIGVKLSVRYLCKPRERRSSASEIWESILDAFATMPDVAFAYPTQRNFSAPNEGKRAEPAMAPTGRAL